MVCQSFHAVDNGLRVQNVLQSVGIDSICYIYTQDQFANPQCSNEPLSLINYLNSHDCAASGSADYYLSVTI